MRCSACGHDNPLGARFCGQCGSPLGAETSPAGPAPGAAQLPATPEVARPSTAVLTRAEPVAYVGFWVRFLAFLIDTAIVWLGAALLSGLLWAAGLQGFPGNAFP
ncbi:MAG: zinc ribbon domain-containing protein [Chloroflexi bacterium]|nr:zinc ribbon domain-containing protein [Chloroflexota bacterium]